jgi:hypothetical protein
MCMPPVMCPRRASLKQVRVYPKFRDTLTTKHAFQLEPINQI